MWLWKGPDMRTEKRRNTSIHIAGRAGLILLLLTLLWGCKKKDQPEAQPGPVDTGAQANRELRILYAGHPGSEREKDFADFLRQYFATVETGDLAPFDGSQSEGFDVTILDYDGDGFKAPRPRLAEGFSRPLLTVGVPGGLMCSQWRLKTGYL
jgi:hypothetical protein